MPLSPQHLQIAHQLVDPLAISIEGQPQQPHRLRRSLGALTLVLLVGFARLGGAGKVGDRDRFVASGPLVDRLERLGVGGEDREGDADHAGMEDSVGIGGIGSPDRLDEIAKGHSQHRSGID